MPEFPQPDWSQLGPGDAGKAECSLRSPASPASRLQENSNSREGCRTLPRQGQSWRGDSESPAGAQRSRGQRKWRSLGGFLSSRNNSSQAVSISTVKQILEISITISYLEGEAAPITFGSVVLGAAKASKGRLTGIFLIVHRRKLPVKTNTHSPACNATPGSNSVLLHPSGC